MQTIMGTNVTYRINSYSRERRGLVAITFIACLLEELSCFSVA